MINMFMLTESMDRLSIEQFQTGIDELVLIEKEVNDNFYKNESVSNLDNYAELYQNFTQENHFRAQYLEQIVVLASNPKSLEALDELFPSMISGFFGINFPQLDINIDYCIHNEQKFSDFKNQCLKLIDHSNFSNLKETFFPNIVFCKDPEEQLKSFGNGKYFHQCIDQFIILENYLKRWENGNFSYKDLNETTAITLSLESQSTMGKYKADRVFSLPTGGTSLFELHIKIGEIRVHILEDNSTKKMMIGYIGKHLKI